MKTILLAAAGVAMAITAQPAMAQMTCNTFGTMQTCNGRMATTPRRTSSET
jgi:hypothetical protein